MGANLERLERLKANRGNIIGGALRGRDALYRETATEVTDSVSATVQKAARSDGFEGPLKETIAKALLEIRDDVNRFVEYQTRLSIAIDQANQALDDTAHDMTGIPDAGLTAGQQGTIALARQTDSPVYVRPGVAMSHSEAQQYYLDQAEAAREDAARQMNVALDSRLQEIIDSLPTSDYDEKPPVDDPSGNDGPGSNPTVNYPGVNSGGGGGGYDGPGVIGNNDGGGNDGTNNDNGGNDGDDTDPPRVVEPPRVYPPVYPPVDPPVYPPGPNDPTGPGGNGGGDDTPRIDGEIGGVTGGGGGGTGFPGGVTGTVGGGAGGLSAGVGGSLGAAGLVGGAAGLAGRLGGGALLGGVGGVGGLGGAGGVGGVGGAGTGAGAGGVVAQSGAANGGRGGMVGGAAAGGGAGGGSDKRSRRRGQDLLAFEVEPDDDQIVPDLGAAGSAGRSASDGREELGW